MKTLKMIIVLLLICNTFSFATDKQLKYSKVDITLNSIDDMSIIRSMGIIIPKAKFTHNKLTTVLNEKEIELLKSTRLNYYILIDDMSSYFSERLEKSKHEIENLQKSESDKYKTQGFKFGSMGGHYTYDELTFELDSMLILYPELITEKESIGKSVEGRDIWMVKISDNPNEKEDEPKILYTALHHSCEPMGLTSVVYYMYYILEKYATDTLVQSVVNNRELYFVPCVNPDGYTYNESTHPNGGGMWRKNKCDNDSNGVFEPTKDGVDLNRNYGYMWAYDTKGSSPNTWSVYYRGKVPFSEPESKAIRDLCLDVNFSLALNYHAAWDKGMYLPPYAYNDSRTPEPDASLFDSLGAIMTKHNGYGWWIPTPQNPYPVNGEAADWMYAHDTENKTFAIVVEVGPKFDVAWPTLEEIYSIAQENVLPNLMFALSTDVVSSIFSPQILSIPNDFLLNQNYPNPFNPSTTIEFTLPKSEFVELKVYNILGKKVSTLVSKKLNQGNHTYTFDGSNLASGLYFYQLMAGEYREVKKMIVFK